MQMEENIRRGLDPQDARRKLGNMTQASEEVYHMNTISFLDEALQNVRFSLRTTRRNPGFALTAVLVLALGGCIHRDVQRAGPDSVRPAALR
jgi:hypothetical protein